MVGRKFIKALGAGALICASVGLGGCETAFDMVGVAQPLSASQAHRFDGSYQGGINLVSATGPGCPASEGERVIMVGDGVLWYAYSPATLFSLPVAYDGAIDGSSGAYTMHGKIDGDHMTLLIKSPTCQADLSLDYIYNRS